ncbi:MAG: hypothetical protein JJT96_20995 [Opitutales bacterium]|nr:hypothetical protein [Opitutales bacterium]
MHTIIRNAPSAANRGLKHPGYAKRTVVGLIHRPTGDGGESPAIRKAAAAPARTKNP